MSPEGTDPRPDRDPRPEGPLPHLDAARHPVRHALRSLRRIRFLRGALLTVAALLLAAVTWEIWSNRPRRKSVQPAPAAQPENATQTLDKFEYTATALGKLAYRILADKLTGVEGGLHTLQRIRRAEFKLSDGRTLTASADHGTFTAGAPSGGEEKGGEGASGGTGPEDANSSARDHGHIVLEGHVVVTSDLGERLESDRIEYFQAESRLVSPGKCHFRLVPPPRDHGGLGPSEGDAGSVTYELTTKVIAMQDGVAIHMTSVDMPDTVATSARARFTADGTSADLEGDARVSRGEEYLAAPHIRLLRSEDGDRTSILAETGAKGRVLPARVRGSTARARPILVAANRIDATDVATTGERRVTLEGEASVEDEPVTGLPPGRTLTARTIDVKEAARTPGAASLTRTARTMHAEDGVRASFPPGPGESALRVLTCARLDAVTAPDGSLATADADGSVTLQSGTRRSVSARAHMRGETHVELRGARPVVEEPEHRIVADEIDYETRPSQLTARGSVQTRFVPSGRNELKADTSGDVVSDQPRNRGGESAAAAPPQESPPRDAATATSKNAEAPGRSPASGALPFTPGVPVDVLSDTAVLNQDAKTAEFTGRVRARQTDRALSADHLLVDDASKTVRADGSVIVRSFREDSAPPPATAAAAPASAGAASTSTAAGPAGGSSVATASTGAVVKIPVMASADTLLHDDTRKMTRFAGHALYREPGRLLTADSITLEGGSGGTPATTRAEGRVVYEGEGKRGTGDLAVHHEDGKTVTLAGNDRPAQVIETASGRSWRGPSLTWVQATDSIPVVTGTSGRSRIVGSISSQPRDNVGKPADRGKPR